MEVHSDLNTLALRCTWYGPHATNGISDLRDAHLLPNLLKSIHKLHFALVRIVYKQKRDQQRSVSSLSDRSVDRSALLTSHASVEWSYP